MAKNIALLIGVSEYTFVKNKDLPNCKNDIFLVKESLIEGLNFQSEDIILLGKNGLVKQMDFVFGLSALALSQKTSDTETFILFFSGHGDTSTDSHKVAFSDGMYPTKMLIDVVNKFPAKNKIIIIDSCYAGAADMNVTTQIKTENISDSIGTGTILLLSCGAEQSSYFDKDYSLFTKFLCDALTDRYIIRCGKKNFNDIHKLLFMLLDIWNADETKRIQYPVFKSNIIGTVYFEVDEYHPYKPDNIYIENDDYIIYDVESISTPSVKRYSVKAIIKKPYSLKEIAHINHEIVNIIKYRNISRSKKEEWRTAYKPANIVFCFFARDEFDINNANYFCRTTWVDATQDKEYWYKKNKNSEVIDDIKFDIHPYYSSLRTFQLKNTGNKDELIIQTKKLIKNMMELASNLIDKYNDYKNRLLTENQLFEEFEKLIPKIEKAYLYETQLDIPPKEIKKWSQHCSKIASTIHDFTYYYNYKYISDRTDKNRKECMEITIKRYYTELDELKEIEQECF